MKSFFVSVLSFMLFLPAFGQSTKVSEEFVAPVIYNRGNINAPQAGLIVFDTKDGAFFGADDTGGWKQLSKQDINYLTSTSSAKTPSGSGHWHSLSGNSVTLTPGDWLITGSASFRNSGTSAIYDNIQAQWSAANGTDTSTTPTLMSTAANLTVNAGRLSTIVTGFTSDNFEMALPVVRVSVSANVTIYLDTFSSQTTSSNARVTTYIYAEKLN